MFGGAEHALNMTLEISCSNCVQEPSFMFKSCLVMFSMFRACSNHPEHENPEHDFHVPEHVFHVPEHDWTRWNMTLMFRTWQPCSEHDSHVLNMMLMFRTWRSCSEHDLSCSNHDSHALNTTVMFCTWHVMFWTRMSCSKHDSYVLNMTIMFLTWLSCSVMFQHVPKQYSSAKSKCSITGFEHKRICTGVNCTNHSTQGLFCKFGREKGLYQNRNLRWFQIENLKWCHTTPSCFTLSQNTISRVLMWVLYYKLNSC